MVQMFPEMFRKMIPSLAMVLAMLTGVVYSAEKICLTEYSSTNLPTSFVESSLELLQVQTAANGVRELMVIDSVYQTSEADVSAWVSSQNCAHLLKLKFIRLGETVQVVQSIKKSGQNSYGTPQIYKASNPDDLNPIMGQLALQLSSDSFEQVESIYTVSNSNVARLKKKRSTDYYSIHIGNMAFVTPEAANTYGLGASWIWDNRDYLGEFELSLMTFGPQRSMGYYNMGINLMVPLEDNDQSFFVGGGLGLGTFLFSKYDANSCTDFSEEASEENDSCYTTESEGTVILGANVGYLVGRTSDFVLRFQVNAKLGLVEIKGSLPMSAGGQLVVGFE